MMPSEKNTLVLIDGHSNVHRSYHAIRETLTNSRGEPTSAVYLFITTFLRLYRELGFRHVAVVFDAPGPSFRSALYPAYKANRPPAPEDLKAQDRRIREALALMGVPTIEVPGWEADDVLGALALQAIAAGGEALVCSIDKDLLQLVRPGLRIYRDHLSKVELLDEAGVLEKMGVPPAQIPTFLGLVGDTADNIPGVPGVGKTTAAKLLAEYGSLEAILAAAPTLKQKKLSENLVAHADAARLSERLATLDTSCLADRPFRWEDWAWEYRPNEGLRAFYQSMEFLSLLADFGGATVEERTTNYQNVTTPAQLTAVVAGIRAAGRAAIDTETTDLDPYKADLVGISLSWRPNQAVYIPLGHAGTAGLTLDQVQAALAPLLTDPAIEWVAHNWGYDYKILRLADFPVADTRVADTLVAAYLLNPEGGHSRRLKDLALSQLGIKMTEISELIGAGDDMITMASVSAEESGRYACQDADATLQLGEKYLRELEAAALMPLFRNVECPLVPVLAEMELEGIRIDLDHFERLGRAMEQKLAALTREIHEIAGQPFNINSPRQLGEILFERLGIPGGKKGKSGSYVTDVSVLESIDHPLARKMLEYRAAEKLRGTYIEPLPGMVHPRTGRLHTSYNQTVAATGRLSSSNPNLQNIPIRTEEGREIRRGFLPRAEGWRLLSADYSQIELRILAHLSGDSALCDAFRSGGDIHTLTAARMFHLEPDAVTPAQRSQAKAINFGIIYGMSDFRLSQDLGIPHDQARQFIEDYFRVYAGVRSFIESTKEQARRDGFVTTMLGRRRFIPDINSRNYNNRSFAERIAVNTPIQGTSADMIKVAMVRVAARLRRESLAARLILQVHDELILDTPEAELDRATALVREEMEAALPLAVPVRVDVKVGATWADC